MLGLQLGTRNDGRGPSGPLKAPAYLLYRQALKPIFKHYQGNSPNLPALAPIQPHTVGMRAGRGARRMTQPSPTPNHLGTWRPSKQILPLERGHCPFFPLRSCDQHFLYKRSSRARPLPPRFALFLPSCLEPVGFTRAECA